MKHKFLLIKSNGKTFCIKVPKNGDVLVWNTVTGTWTPVSLTEYLEKTFKN